MTARAAADDRRTDGATPTVVVRIPANDGSWPRWLPRVPSGATVTVSVSTPALAQVAPDDLIGTGYILVGVVPTGLAVAGRAVLDLVVEGGLSAEHPRWWAKIHALADRTFVTSFGPVAAALAPVLASHAAIRSPQRRVG